MVDHGAFLRVGARTNQDTQIGTFASSTGLPQQSSTTSFGSTNIGAASGHDQPSGFSGQKTSNLSLAGGSSIIVSYISNNSTPSGNQGTPTFNNPSNVLTNNNAGTSLPTPTGPHFKMIGYYVTGAVYESFVVTGTPAPSTTTNPNTGHTLINTYVANTW